MPVAFPATVAEREAELVALQNAFDEYIASSRELEEELDAELAKMQEKLAESSSANAALSSQLENIGPQLTALETALSESRQKLKEEQRLRRAAEQAQDEADQRLREMEQSIQHVREECDVVHEELAFKENELEESKLELEVEKQQLQNEVKRLREEVQKLENNKISTASTLGSAISSGENDSRSDVPQINKAHTVDDSVPSVDEAYVKKLEEELELVTEQLIETEKRLSETENELKEMTGQAEELKQQVSRDDDEDLIESLKAENADHLEAEQRLRDELELTKEELALAKEEIQLQQEEIHAFELEMKNMNVKMDEERTKHREEVNLLNIRLKESEISTENRLGQAAKAMTSIKEASEENMELREQIAALEAALTISRSDYQTILDELDAVNARFDEAREEAKREGRELAQEELRSAMKSDVQEEIKEMREHLTKLTEENTRLQRKIDETKLELASAKDSSNQSPKHNNGASSELVKQLQEQLNRAKDELAKKDREMVVLSSKLEERVSLAEENVGKLESELRATKSQLAESEAHLIVLRREKDRMDKDLLVKPGKSTENGERNSALRSYSSRDSIDRDELSTMDLTPSARAINPFGRNRARSKSPTSVMRLELKLAEEVKRYDALQKDYESLQDQKRMGEVRIKRLEEDLKVLQKQLLEASPDSAVVTSMTRLSSLAAAKKNSDILFEDDGQDRRVESVIASKDFRYICDELRLLEKQCNRHREYNSQLLSKILHLQGNIQVYCRVRPMTYNEIEKGEKSVIESLSETEVGCFDSRTNKWKSFAFDRVWGPDQSQQSVFQDVEPLALSVIDGFNACIFAYGQTGSGKTFTMEGIDVNHQYGISYRTIQKIFHLLNLRAQQQKAAEMFVGSENEDEPAKEVKFTFSLELGMLEIYNDDVYDLLATQGASTEEKKQEAIRAGGKASLEIKRNKEGRIEVPNLTKEKVGSIKEVMELLKRGNSNRATATTDMNEHSSRSHMVLMVDVYSGLDESQRNKGTLYLVDLAGSERVRKSNVQGDQLKEAGFINRSLSALGNVMEALDRKASHVPYRDSKLTYMLQDSLGGNSRTMMVVTICPCDNSYDETVHALQFATRVRRIQLGAAQRNVTAKNLEETVKSLTEEMRALTRAKERTEGQLLSLKRDNARVQDKLQSLTKARTQNRADGKTLEVLKKNNDDMAKRWQKEKAAREEVVEDLDKSQKENRTLQQQLSKAKSKLQMLEEKLEEKERDLEVASKQLRQQSNAKSAATLRARRDQVLNSKPKSPKQEKLVDSPPKELTPSHSSTTGGAVAESPPKPKNEVANIREKVLSLLEKYDKGKVNRIDIIMEKFKGKEALLLEKMTQRYEADSSTTGTSVQQRNQIALERHQERMQKIRDKKQPNGSAATGTPNH